MENKSRLPTMIKKPSVIRAHVPTDRSVATASTNILLSSQGMNKTALSSSLNAKSHNVNRPALTSFENVLNNLRHGTTATGMVNRPTKRHASPEFRSSKASAMGSKRLRRSRSVSDIDAILSMAQEQKRAATRPFRVPLAPPPKVNAIKVCVGVAKAKPSLTTAIKAKVAPSHKKLATNKTVAALTAKKENDENGTKPKVITGGKKIPPYDFKARFHDLVEKHKVLKEKHERLKEQFGEFESLPEQYDECRAKLSNLESENKSVQEQLAKMEQKNAEDEQKIRTLNADLNAKIEECRTLIEAKDTITAKYNAVNTERSELKTDNAKLETKLKTQQDMVEHLTLELQEAGEQLFRANIDRKDLHNTIMDLRGNIRVFCRIRPPLTGEENRMLCSWQHNDETSLEIGN